MIFVVFLAILLTILLFFAFFGWRRTEKIGKIEETVVREGNSNISKKGPIEGIHEENARILEKLEEKCHLKHLEQDSEVREESEAGSQENLEKLKNSCEKLILKLDDVAKVDSKDVELQESSGEQLEDLETSESLQSSPKSTSSCVSSTIFTDNATSPHRTPSRPTSLSGSSPVLSVASCPAPFFDFKRKTPEFVPRMMTEEFESLNRSIEKRKIDIRDLLKRIESTKRQHRRFSEHLQRVQHDHLLDY